MNLLNIISIFLTLGSAPDCDGFGMCIVEPQTEQTAENCLKYENCIQAEMEYLDRELILIVSQNKIKDKAFVKYFTKEYFELDKNYTLPSDIVNSLGCPEETTIEKGKYPINEEDGRIVVRFKL